MNISRYELELKKDADRLHVHAQQTGEKAAYLRAAEFYERAGDFRQARACREAVEVLAKAEGR